MDRLSAGFALAVVLVAAVVGLAAVDVVPQTSGGPAPGETLRPAIVAAVLLVVAGLVAWAHDRPREEG